MVTFWGGSIKENDREVNLTRYIINTFVNVTMCPQYNNNEIIKII
jgi:hypothetical protein